MMFGQREPRNDYVPWLNAAASFACGAMLAWLVAEGVQRARKRIGPVSDDLVLERVRGRVFEIVTQPEAVQVTVVSGVVRLAGEVPAQERDELLTQIVHMPGVVRLRNALAVSSL